MSGQSIDQRMRPKSVEQERLARIAHLELEVLGLRHMVAEFRAKKVRDREQRTAT